MKRWAGVLLGCGALMMACATGLLTNQPDGGGGDASGSPDVAPDSSGCPQYDIMTDPKHCGSCTNACGTGMVCSSGKCQASCGAPTVTCNTDAGPICANPTNDPQHCGQCTNACTTADAGGMVPGTGNPDPGLFDGGYDGGTGWSLGTPVCASSTCRIDCPDAMALCTDDICYDLQNHHDHCGTCGTGCMPTTEWCDLGHCCGLGTTWCGSSCASILSDTQNCGACGNVCDGGGCSGGKCVACAPTTIAGISLTQNISGWANAGLRIKALKNTTITSFVVNNQGTSDTVSLTDTSGTVLQSTTVPASTPTYTATVSWSLTAGTSYDLILSGGTGGNNGKWDMYSGFPVSDTGIEVDAVVNSSQALFTTYWFTFTNITSCP